MDALNIVIAVAALALSVFTAFGFYKAGSFKAKSPRETLLAAGFGWVEKTPFGVVRLVAWLEILGALGIVLAPLAAYFAPGFAWAQVLGVAAAAGLALTMIGAFWVHAARGEAKYTWKMNLNLFLVATVSAVLQALVVLPLF
jgi:DoxX-like family